MYPVGHEPKTSPSTLLLQGKEIPFELELVGTTMYVLTYKDEPFVGNQGPMFSEGSRHNYVSTLYEGLK